MDLRNAPPSPAQRFLETLMGQRRAFGLGLIVAGAFLALGATVAGFQADEEARFGFSVNWDYWPLWIGGTLMALVCLAVGLWMAFGDPDQATEAGFRVAVLSTGGMFGLVLALATAAQAWLWRSEILFGGLEAWQGPYWWRLWVCAAAELAGLGIMLASLLLARREERSSAVLRRLLYGYNTVLMGLLLLANLVMLNILVYQHYPASYQWAGTRGFYEPSSRTRNILAHLKEPVHVYVIMDEGDRVYRDVRTLLDQLQALTSKLEVTTLFRNRQETELIDLMSRFPSLAISRGLVVVYGHPTSSGKTLASFIPRDTLFQESPARPGEPARMVEFRGEDVLMSEIHFLAEGKKKQKIYFTQNAGELPITDSRENTLGMGQLLKRLQLDNFDVAGLWLRVPPPGWQSSPVLVIAPDVPADAAAVVIVNPQRPFSAEAVAALDRYLKKNGKLLVCLDLISYTRREWGPFATGLDRLLGDFGVDVGKSFILRSSLGEEALQIAASPPENSSQPVARALEGKTVRFHLPRPVRRRPASGGRRVDVLLEARRDEGVWVEDDLTVLRNLAHYLLGLGQSQRKRKLARENVPVAIAVSDIKDDTPRMVVVGSAVFVSNIELASNENAYPFFENSLEWLLGRGERLGIPPLKSGRYTVDVDLIKPRLARMRWLPIWVIGVSILGLGVGMWVVRRR
jgi:hypothetical protein